MSENLELELATSKCYMHAIIQRIFGGVVQDLEEQSRLIAASSRPANSAGADGHFVVLSNSQSEDSDAGGDEGKKCESDA